MIRITQPGVHPDPESLNAFAELALPQTERQQILGHLASCDRCREVVFLAQKATGTETEACTVTASTEPVRRWKKWFEGWRWSWVPATALAGLMGLAVLHHYRNVPQRMEVAQNTPQEPVQTDSSAKTQPPSSPDSEQLSETKAAALSAPSSKDLSVTARKKLESANQPSAVRDNNKATKDKESVEIARSQRMQTQPYRGEIRPAQKPSSIGGPYVANNAYQQQAPGHQEIAQDQLQDQLHSARYSAKVPGVGGAAVATTNAGRADAQNLAYPAAPVAAPARQAAAEEAAKSSLAATTDAVSLDKKAIVALPNGMRALSAATLQGRTVAIDPSGSMFLSEAPGGQWLPVAIQWNGRAVLVRTQPTQPKSKGSSQSTLFELVNDVNETWVSSDGKAWTAKPLSPQ